MESRMFATGRAEARKRRSEPGKSANGRAGERAVGASRKHRTSAARGGNGSESCRFAAGVAGGRDSRLYYATIKIETPEASVSGVFNLRLFFPDSHSPASAPLPLRCASRITLGVENPLCYPVSCDERRCLPPRRLFCLAWHPCSRRGPMGSAAACERIHHSHGTARPAR